MVLEPETCYVLPQICKLCLATWKKCRSIPIEGQRSQRICRSYPHAREPLYSNSAVIAWCSQSSGAQNILFWFTVIHSMSQYFTAFNFHDNVFIWNYCLREFHNKVPPDKMPLLCRKFCVINKPFTENIVYFACKTYVYPKK